ncbi:MAG: Ig-like domain-containing protein [Parabacteroides sp.]|nr:Ig-like domain-containing protein [Parabacteroides sp.]
MVTAGLSASDTDYPLEKLGDTTYTFLMPSSTLYINVHVAAASGYLIRVQTPGVSGAQVKLEALNAAGGAGTVVEAGTPSIAKGAKVRASLTLPTEEKGTFSLRELAGYATDGSWTLLPVGTEVPKEVTFVMPASDVVLRYTIGYEANTTDTPKEDSPEAPKVEVPEIVWPADPQEKPVVVVISEVEEGRQAALSEQLATIVTDDPETVSEVVDISLRQDGKPVQPKEGEPVTVTYPYPQGTDGTWNFQILHMISDDPAKPAEFEMIYPEALHIGLRFKVSHFSPFGIVYTPPVGENPVRVTGVKLSAASLGLSPGESRKLEATLTPADATDRRLEWTSSDEGVATVSADGTVTAVAAGTASVEARTLNGGFTATCEVTVTGAPDPDPTPDPDPEPPVANERVDSVEPTLLVSPGQLRVTSPAPVAVEVYDISGRRYLSAAAAESHQLSLPSGLWLVRLGDRPTEKIVVP